MAEAVNGGGQNEELRLKALRRARTGKKISITKRIKQLNRLVSEESGRRAMELLLNGLQTVFGELEQVCETISTLIDEDEELNDVESIRFDVDSCVAVVTEYLEFHNDDPRSSSSSIALDWVRKHDGRFGMDNDDDSSNHSIEDVKEVSF